MNYYYPLDWFFIGTIVCYFLLVVTTTRVNYPKTMTPEAFVYDRTIYFIYLHMIAGLIVGSVQYVMWYREMGPQDHFWEWWPMFLVYAACLLFDFAIKQLFFKSAYVRYCVKP